MSDAEFINNQWLNGTPYLVSVDAAGEERAKALLAEQLRIQQRQQSLKAAFAAQAYELRAELDRDFDLRLVFESNAIEGVTTSFEETKAFLETASEEFLSNYSFGAGIDADPKLLEVVGHGRALSFVRDLARDLAGRPLREVDIRDIHALTMAAEPRIAGKYKTMDNEIGGRDPGFLTTRSDDVSWHVRQLTGWLAEARVHGPLLAAVASAWLADIHPFDDGNGRVSRLLANYVLLRYGWPCLIIRAGPDRQRYYDALASSDGGDIAPLFSLYVEGLHRTLSEMEDPDFARSLLERDLARQKAFDAWTAILQRFTQLLRDEARASMLDFEVIGNIDESDFAWLARRDPAGNGWWCKARSAGRSVDVLLWFGYQSNDLMSASPGLKLTPSIFISERDRDPAALHPYRPTWNDPRLPVHEITLQPRAKQERAIVRRGSETTELALHEAAAELVRAVRSLDTGQAPSRH